MRSVWPVFAVGMLLVLGPRPDAQGQPRPRPGTSATEVRSRFGSRSLGFPVTPKPRDFGGGGLFGPRPNFRRGFTAPRSPYFWEAPSPEPVFVDQANVELRRAGGEAAQLLEERGESMEQPAPLFEQSELGAGEAEQVVGQPGEFVAQPEGIVATGPQELASGTAGPASGTEGPAASAGRSAAAGGRPSYEWSTDSIRTLPAESLLADRLQKVLRSRLGPPDRASHGAWRYPPLEVTIRQETAILRGVVATQRDRLLAGHLARFEPGVREVKNELTVDAAAPGPSAEFRVPSESPE